MSGADESPIGCTGRITLATRGTDGLGEVEVGIRGGRETFMARSDAPLAAGAVVIVISAVGPRTVEVVPWVDPVETTPFV